MAVTRCDVLSLLWMSIQGAMSYFFGCFRVRDDHRRPYPCLSVSDLSFPSSSSPSLPCACVVPEKLVDDEPWESALSRNELLSLLYADLEKEERTINYSKSLVDPPAELDSHESGLKEEAKLLKACGVLPETPAEIRKLSKKLKDSPQRDSQSPQFHFWLPTNSASKLLQIEKLSQDLLITLPTIFSQIPGSEPATIDSPASNSCMVCEENEPQICVNFSAKGELVDTRVSVPAVNHQYETPNATLSLHKNKSVRFKAESEISPGTSHENQEKPEWFKGSDVSILRLSPYPTPLKLGDDMQTPGTVFASGNNNNARVRTQYVYTIANPTENPSYLKILEDMGDSVDDNSSSNKERYSGSHLCNPSPRSDNDEKENSIEKASPVELSLCPWLRQPHFDEDGNHGKKLGLVVAQKEFSQVSSRQWYGNGIPNTTSKYNEDQKVKWRATPFEERLEKALNEESFIFKRKPSVVKPAMVLEEEEDDTAATLQLQPPSNLKPAVL